jgi:hypothetical protein
MASNVVASVTNTLNTALGNKTGGIVGGSEFNMPLLYLD